MDKNIFPQCPICAKDIISDANAPGYCQLCGMALDSYEEFCCNSRRDKFDGIRGVQNERTGNL